MATKAELRGKITLDNSLFKAGLKNATGMAKSFASTVGGTLKSFITSPLGMIGSALAGLFVFKSFAGGIAGAIRAGSEMKKLSEQTGVTVGTFMTLGKAFKDADVDSELVVASLARMQRMLFAADKGSAQAHAAIATLHLKFNDLIKMDPGKQFQAIGDRILAIKNPTERAGMAMMFFGKAGTQLIPVFREIANTDFGDLSEKAEVMQRNANLFFDIVHGFRRLGTSFRAVYLGIADKIAPALKDILGMIPKINFLHIGQTIGQGMATAYAAVKGFITTWRTSLPELGKILLQFFKAEGLVWLSLWKMALGGIANAIAAIFSKSFWTGIWSQMTDGFLEAVKKMLTAFSGFGEKMDKFLGFSPDAIIDKITGVQKQDMTSDERRALINQPIPSPYVVPFSGINAGPRAFGFGAGAGGKGGFGVGHSGFGFNPSTQLSLFDKGVGEFKDAITIFKQVGSQLKGLVGKAVLAGTPKIQDEIKDGMKNGWRFSGFGGLKTGSLVTPSLAGGLSDILGPFMQAVHTTTLNAGANPLNRGAYGKTSLLRHEEIAAIVDKAVASGQDRDALSPGGYHAIRRGDHARAREAQREQLRQKLGVEKTNEILSDIDGKMTDMQKAMNGES